MPEWNEYWELVEQLTGCAVSAPQRAAQFRIGRFLITIQYLPFAIEHFPEDQSRKMMDEALEHCRALQGAVEA